MYAIVADSGKQFFVEEGERVLVDRRPAEPGESIELDRVLLLGGDGSTVVGRPLVEGAKVLATVTRHLRAKKIHVQTYKRRKNYRRHMGHRQPLTEVQIEQILPPLPDAAPADTAAQTPDASNGGAPTSGVVAPPATAERLEPGLGSSTGE